MKTGSSIRNKNPRQAFRKRIGFSQDTYAIYLGVSKSLLSLAELGLRSLSGEASLKNANLLLRWQNFEKTWVPLPHSPTDLEGAQKYLLERMADLEFIQKTHVPKRRKSRESMDYHKARAFLESELTNLQNPEDELPLSFTKRMVENKIQRTPYLDGLKADLKARFLAFQLAEIEKELRLLKEKMKT
jgi:transcriptional regulator with XRE-family HTH domain